MLALLVALAAPVHAEDTWNPIAEIAIPERPPVETWQRADGTEVLLVADDRVPLVSIQLRFPVGTWSPWFSEAHAEEAWDLQDDDPEQRLARAADVLAADISVWSGDQDSGISVLCLGEDVEAVVDLLNQITGNRDYDHAELARRQQGQTLGYAASQKEPNWRMMQAGAGLLFAEGDPRARDFEKPGRIEKDSETLAQARDRVLATPGRMIGFAGALSPAEARALSDRIVLPPPLGEPFDAPAYQPLRDDRPSEHEVEMPRLTQVYLGYGRPSLTWTDPDYPAFLVADHVLAGHFYSRLYKALRHDEGDTYGVGSRAAIGDQPGMYGITTFTRTDNDAEIEAKLLATMQVFREGGITEEERAAAVSNMRGRLLFELEQPATILQQEMWGRVHDLPGDYRRQVVEKAAALSLEDVNAFITRYYDPAEFTMVRVGSE